jgi:hypothetical protein
MRAIEAAGMDEKERDVRLDEPLPADVTGPVCLIILIDEEDSTAAAARSRKDGC